MTITRLARSALLWAATIPALWAAEPPDLRPLQAIDLFDIGWASQPRVSPDGDFVVYQRNFMDIMQDRRRSNLWRVDADGGDHRPLTTGAVNDTGAEIAPDGKRVAYLSRDETGTQVFVQWLASGARAQLTRLPRAPGNLQWSPNGEWLAFTMLVPSEPVTMGELPPAPEGAEWAPPPRVVDRPVYRRDGSGFLPRGHLHLFVVPASGGSPRQLTHGDFNHGGGFSWTSDSASLVVSANRNPDWALDYAESELYRVPLAGGEITRLTSRRGADAAPRVEPGGDRIAYLGFDDEGQSHHQFRLYLMNGDGSGVKEVLPDFARSIQEVHWDAGGRGLFFRYDSEGRTRLAYTSLSGKWQELADNLGGLSLGRPYSGGQFSVGGGGVYAFTGGSALSPADLFTSRRGSRVARQLTRLSANLLDHRDLAKMDTRWVKSRFDGRDIQAWVAYPPGFDPQQKYPLLLEIHGGPHTAYGPHFSMEVQLYAAAGYVVLYVNPRGSTSYGTEFARLINRNYPGEDYDDLMSAVDSVIADGATDTERLFVTGGSGGGVLTAWIVGSTDRFRAAVVAKPVINWTSFTLTADLVPYFARYWFGDMPWEIPEEYWRRSPLSLVGKVTTPTMLLTGEVDYRTPMSESEQYYAALKLRGVDTALVRVPEASHGIAQRPSQLLAKTAAVLAWFERHDPAAGGDADETVR